MPSIEAAARIGRRMFVFMLFMLVVRPKGAIVCRLTRLGSIPPILALRPDTAADAMFETPPLSKTR